MKLSIQPLLLYLLELKQELQSVKELLINGSINVHKLSNEETRIQDTEDEQLDSSILLALSNDDDFVI